MLAQLLSRPFYRWDNWGTERLRHLSQVPYQVRFRAEFELTLFGPWVSRSWWQRGLSLSAACQGLTSALCWKNCRCLAGFIPIPQQPGHRFPYPFADRALGKESHFPIEPCREISSWFQLSQGGVQTSLTANLWLAEPYFCSAKSLWPTGLSLLGQHFAILVGPGVMTEIPVVHISEHTQFWHLQPCSWGSYQRGNVSQPCQIVPLKNRLAANPFSAVVFWTSVSPNYFLTALEG